MRLSPIVQAPRTRQQLHNVIGRYYDPAICLLPVYEAELQLKRCLLPV